MSDCLDLLVVEGFCAMECVEMKSREENDAKGRREVAVLMPPGPEESSDAEDGSDAGLRGTARLISRESNLLQINLPGAAPMAPSGQDVLTLISKPPCFALVAS